MFGKILSFIVGDKEENLPVFTKEMKRDLREAQIRFNKSSVRINEIIKNKKDFLVNRGYSPTILKVMVFETRKRKYKVLLVKTAQGDYILDHRWNDIFKNRPHLVEKRVCHD